jgi:hypothetical protein
MKSQITSVVVVLVLLVCAAVSSKTQTQCPPPSLVVVESFAFPWQGSCCEAVVTACISPPPNRIISLVGVQLIGDCWGEVNPELAPYNEVAVLGFEKILLRRHQLLGMPVIPQCPNSTTVTVETRVGSCGYYTSYLIPVANADGSQGTRTVREYIACGTAECTRSCTVCVMSTLDPCNNSEYRLFWTCDGQVSAPQCPTTGCKYPMCSSALP